MSGVSRNLDLEDVRSSCMSASNPVRASVSSTKEMLMQRAESLGDFEKIDQQKINQEIPAEELAENDNPIEDENSEKE